MRICKTELAVSLCAFFCAGAFCQDAQSAPVAPVAPMTQLQMPQMPSVSAPTAGTNFYVPGSQYLQGKKAAEEKKEAGAEAKNSGAEKKEAAAASLERLLDGVSKDAFSGLSAWDLSQLARRGAIGSLSSLSAVSDGPFDLGAASVTAASQQKVLAQILSELEQIKAAQGSLVPAAPAGSRPSSLPPKILRFSVDSRDIECAQVFFSEREADGSFLLTGDVRTPFQGGTVSETFYLLFAANGTSNSRPEYLVTPTLSQSEPAQTPLSRLCSAQGFTATRTGNLVMLHCAEDDRSCDLLLDIGSPAGAR